MDQMKFDKTALPNVSIVIPAFREVGTVGNVVRNAVQVLNHRDVLYEIIVVDDGSPDATGAEAAAAGARVVRHPYNRGYGASLRSGILEARGAIVVTMDADGQHDPNDLGKLLDLMSTFDMVVGLRPKFTGSPPWRQPGKLLLGFVASQLTGRRIPDLNCGLRAMRRDMIVRLLPIMPDGFSFSTTSTIAVIRCGYTLDHVPISIQRRQGKSTLTPLDGLRAIMLVVRLMTLFAPLRVFLPVTAVTFLLGLGFIITSYISHGEASLKGIIVILASILFFLFGILVDQIAALRRGESVS